MGTRARLTRDGDIVIDVDAWLEGRTGGIDGELTVDLLAATYTLDEAGDGEPPNWPAATRSHWPRLARTWLRQEGAYPDDPIPVMHCLGRLPAGLWALRAELPGWGPIAVVAVPGRQVGVYADTGELASWYDDDVDIICPAGHGWTWRDSHELITADGDLVRVGDVFGPALNAPLQPCPYCLAHRVGTAQRCPCDGTPWILCPTCGQRCDIELPTR